MDSDERQKMQESQQEVPVEVGTPENLEALLCPKNGELVVLYFWGPDCPNCDVFASHLPKLLEQLKGEPVVLVKIDAYTHPNLATRYGLFGIPHFLLFRDGQKLGRMSEFRGDAWWLAVVRDHLPKRSE